MIILMVFSAEIFFSSQSLLESFPTPDLFFFIFQDMSDDSYIQILHLNAHLETILEKSLPDSNNTKIFLVKSFFCEVYIPYISIYFAYINFRLLKKMSPLFLNLEDNIMPIKNIQCFNQFPDVFSTGCCQFSNWSYQFPSSSFSPTDKKHNFFIIHQCVYFFGIISFCS